MMLVTITIALLPLIAAVAGDVIVSCDVVLVDSYCACVAAAIGVEGGAGAGAGGVQGGGGLLVCLLGFESELLPKWPTDVETIIEGVTHHTYGVRV